MISDLVDKIVDKLKIADIKYIISIDNDWVPTKSEIDLETNLQQFLTEKSINLSKNVEVALSNDSDIQTIKELIESPNSNLVELKREINQIIEQKAELQPALKSLDELFTIICQKYSEITIVKDHTGNIDFSQYKDNCLIILDKNMEKGDNDAIVQNIFKINKNGQSKNDIILVYSSETINEYKNNASKIAYLNGKNIEEEHKELLIYKMWAMGKKGRFEELLPEMHEMLLKSMYGNALYKIIQHKLKVEENTYLELIKIDTDDLSNSIKASFIEGENIIQSLDRISESLKRKNEFTMANEIYMSSIESLISYEREKIDEMMQDVVSDGYNKFKLEQLRNKLISSCTNSSDYTVIDYGVNRYYSDLATGDLFRFKGYNQQNWLYGILVTQSCSCIIRIPNSDIKHVKRDAEQMQLLLLDGEEIQKVYSKNELDKIKKNDCFWPVKIDDKSFKFSSTEKIISIPSHILDLCSLDSNGIANTDFDHDSIKKYKPYHSLKYFSAFKDLYFSNSFTEDGENIANTYEEIINNLYSEISSETACTNDGCEYYSRIGIETQTIKQKVFEKTVSLKYGINFADNKFELERIGRLDSQRTLILIQDYIYNLSKAGAEPIPVNS